MTRIYVQNVRSQTTGAFDFKDVVSANGASQWLDTYGVIKANKTTIDESVTIPEEYNAVTAGTIKVSPGCVVTIRGDWSIV